MSAFVVHDAHIHALVDFAREHSRGTLYAGAFTFDLRVPEERDRLGLALLRANVASVNCRYGENDPVGPYKFKRPARSLTPVEAIKAVNCLKYQSCEVPEWRGSDAKRIMDEIQALAIVALPGYAEAPWAIKD